MAYTHNFEIKLGGVVVEGEIAFNHGEPPHFKTDAAEAMDVTQHKYVQRVFEFFVEMYKDFGSIDKIELNVKP